MNAYTLQSPVPQRTRQPMFYNIINASGHRVAEVRKRTGSWTVRGRPGQMHTLFPSRISYQSTPYKAFKTVDLLRTWIRNTDLTQWFKS